MVDDGEKWSREGKKDEKETLYYNPEILAEAETIVGGQIAPTVSEKTEEDPTYDVHLKFIGKKLSDINSNLNQTNENLWWLSIGIKVSISLIFISIGYGIFWSAGESVILVSLGLVIAITGLIVLLVLSYKILSKFSKELDF